MVNYKDILSMSKTIKDYYIKNQTYPKSVKIKGNDYSIQQATYLMATFIVTTAKDIEIIKVNGASDPNGDRCNREVIKKTYTNMSERLVEYIKKKHQLPNYVTIDGKQKCSIILFIYQLSKICAGYSNNKFPDRILINSADLQKPAPKPTPTNNVFEHFTKVFGKVTTFSQALNKVHGKGYGYYFENCMRNIDVIDGLANPNGKKPNCVDICQMMWWIAKGLGYDVRCLHVYCPVSKITHVRLQIRHEKYTEGKWENYDPAAVADGESISSLWCAGSGAYVIDTNPGWFMEGLNE